MASVAGKIFPLRSPEAVEQSRVRWRNVTMGRTLYAVLAVARVRRMIRTKVARIRLRKATRRRHGTPTEHGDGGGAPSSQHGSRAFDGASPLRDDDDLDFDTLASGPGRAPDSVAVAREAVRSNTAFVAIVRQVWEVVTPKPAVPAGSRTLSKAGYLRLARKIYLTLVSGATTDAVIDATCKLDWADDMAGSGAGSMDFSGFLQSWLELAFTWALCDRTDVDDCCRGCTRFILGLAERICVLGIEELPPGVERAPLSELLSSAGIAGVTRTVVGTQVQNWKFVELRSDAEVAPPASDQLMWTASSIVAALGLDARFTHMIVAAAAQISRVWRGGLGRSKVRRVRRQRRLDNACVEIQRHIRGWLGRVEYAQKRRTAIAMSPRQAAAVISVAYKNYTARQLFAAFRFAAQTALRRKRAREEKVAALEAVHAAQLERSRAELAKKAAAKRSRGVHESSSHASRDGTATWKRSAASRTDADSAEIVGVSTAHPVASSRGRGPDREEEPVADTNGAQLLAAASADAALQRSNTLEAMRRRMREREARLKAVTAPVSVPTPVAPSLPVAEEMAPATDDRSVASDESNMARVPTPRPGSGPADRDDIINIRDPVDAHSDDDDDAAAASRKPKVARGRMRAAKAAAGGAGAAVMPETVETAAAAESPAWDPPLPESREHRELPKETPKETQEQRPLAHSEASVDVSSRKSSEPGVAKPATPPPDVHKDTTRVTSHNGDSLPRKRSGAENVPSMVRSSTPSSAVSTAADKPGVIPDASVSENDVQITPSEGSVADVGAVHTRAPAPDVQPSRSRDVRDAVEQDETMGRSPAVPVEDADPLMNGDSAAAVAIDDIGLPSETQDVDSLDDTRAVIDNSDDSGGDATSGAGGRDDDETTRAHIATIRTVSRGSAAAHQLLVVSPVSAGRAALVSRGALSTSDSSVDVEVHPPAQVDVLHRALAIEAAMTGRLRMSRTGQLSHREDRRLSRALRRSASQLVEILAQAVSSSDEANADSEPRPPQPARTPQPLSLSVVDVGRPQTPGNIGARSIVETPTADPGRWQPGGQIDGSSATTSKHEVVRPGPSRPPSEPRRPIVYSKRNRREVGRRVHRTSLSSVVLAPSNESAGSRSVASGALNASKDTFDPDTDSMFLLPAESVTAGRSFRDLEAARQLHELEAETLLRSDKEIVEAVAAAPRPAGHLVPSLVNMTARPLLAKPNRRPRVTGPEVSEASDDDSSTDDPGLLNAMGHHRAPRPQRPSTYLLVSGGQEIIGPVADDEIDDAVSYLSTRAQIRERSAALQHSDGRQSFKEQLEQDPESSNQGRVSTAERTEADAAVVAVLTAHMREATRWAARTIVVHQKAGIPSNPFFQAVTRGSSHSEEGGSGSGLTKLKPRIGQRGATERSSHGAGVSSSQEDESSVPVRTEGSGTDKKRHLTPADRFMLEFRRQAESDVADGDSPLRRPATLLMVRFPDAGSARPSRHVVRIEEPAWIHAPSRPMPRESEGRVETIHESSRPPLGGTSGSRQGRHHAVGSDGPIVGPGAFLYEGDSFVLEAHGGRDAHRLPDRPVREAVSRRPVRASPRTRRMVEESSSSATPSLIQDSMSSVDTDVVVAELSAQVEERSRRMDEALPAGDREPHQSYSPLQPQPLDRSTLDIFGGRKLQRSAVHSPAPPLRAAGRLR